jgi:hypothetical protein
MLTNILQVEHVQKIMKKKGYAFFENGQYNLNIIGVRSKKREAGSFEDFICCLFKDSNDKWISHYWAATTDAGTYWLKNPMSKKGTAILVPNQYKGVYKLGLHQGKYKALVQNKPMKVYRDNNKNFILDMDSSKIEEGIFGINIHRSNPKGESALNEKWSAGCQVFSSSASYLTFIGLCEKAASIYGNSFTYTLLEQEDFENI